MIDLDIRNGITPEQLDRIMEAKKSNALSDDINESCPDKNSFKDEFLKQKYLEEQEKERQQRRKTLKKLYLDREFAKKQRIRRREEQSITKEKIVDQVNYTIDLKNARLKEKYGIENAAGNQITTHEGIAHLLFDGLA